VPELIHRAGLGFHVMGQPVDRVGGHDTFVIFHRAICSGRIPKERERAQAAPRMIVPNSVAF
jgi:hypothetical protein